MTADTRRDRTRLRRGRVRQRHVALLLLFALAASGMGAWLANPAPATADTTVRASIGVQGRPDPFPAADRDRTRTDLTVDGTWDMGDRPEGKLTIIHADNPTVRDLINGRDEDQTRPDSIRTMRPATRATRTRTGNAHGGRMCGARNWDCRSAAGWGWRHVGRFRQGARLLGG